MMIWKKKSNFFFSGLFFLIAFTSNAQIDSVYLKARKQYILDSTKICKAKNIRPQLGLDNRISFIRKSPVDISGYFVGILLKNHFKFTLGYYQVTAESHASIPIKDKAITTIRNLDLYYTTFNFEYIPINKRYIKLGLPVDLGYGFSNLTVYSEDKTKVLYHSSGNFQPFSFGTTLTLKPLRWIGVTGLTGYRKILNTTEKRINFDGLFYAYGLSIDVKEIIKDVRLLKAKKRFKSSLKK